MEREKYRITIEGFKVITQIPDTYSGKGDRGNNVFVSIPSLWEDPSGKPQYMFFSKVSPIYGDRSEAVVDESRPSTEQTNLRNTLNWAAREGKGLKNGEEIPYPSPWIRKATVSRELLPMLVVESDFTGYDGFAFIPSIWSWAKEDVLHASWLEELRVCLSQSSRKIFRIFELLRIKSENSLEISESDFLLRCSTLGLPIVKIDLASDSDFFSPKTRPIGMGKDVDRFAFDPKVLVLNSISAKVCSEMDRGFGKGVIPFEFAEEIGGGNYQLFIKIEPC